MRKRYPFSLLLALCIVVVSLIPIPETRLEDIPFYDKWTHALMYGALSLMAWWEHIRGREKVEWKEALVVAAVAPAALGGALELAQAYLTTCRSGDWLDFAANSVGVALASACACSYILYKRKG